MSRARSGFACGVTALVALVAACATPLRESSWVVAESPHFEIHSTLSADRTRALGDLLERFRALVLAVTNAKRTDGGDGGERTRIFAFGSLAQYSQFGPKGSTGFLLPDTRRETARRVGIEATAGAGSRSAN